MMLKLEFLNHLTVFEISQNIFNDISNIEQDFKPQENCVSPIHILVVQISGYINFKQII